jgi:hypothetical protein
MATIWLDVSIIFAFLGLILGLALYLFGQTTAAAFSVAIGGLPAAIGITVLLAAVVILGVASSVSSLVQAIRG